MIKFGLSRIDNVILLQTSEFKRDGGTLSAFYGVTSRFTEDNYGKQVDEKAFEKFQEVVRDNFCLDFIGLEADSLTPGNVITSSKELVADYLKPGRISPKHPMVKSISWDGDFDKRINIVTLKRAIIVSEHQSNTTIVNNVFGASHNGQVSNITAIGSLGTSWGSIINAENCGTITSSKYEEEYLKDLIKKQLQCLSDTQKD